MRAVLQRVHEASVVVEGEIVGQIRKGWLVLLGVGQGDSEADVDWLTRKIVGLRAFPDDQGKMSLDVREIGGALLVVSQFTLHGDCRKGRRPDFTAAAPPDHAEALYKSLLNQLADHGLTVEGGRFGAHMDVHLINDGPVTLLLDSEKTF